MALTKTLLEQAVILARVSSKAQEDEGYSLDSQVKLLTGYCDSKGFRIKKVFKIAETASKEQSRKVFKELLKYLHENGVHHLVAEKTDRLTRNMRDAVAIDDWLQVDGQRTLHLVKENIQLHKDSKSDVKFMWNIHLAVAKKYADNLREESMKGWAEKLAQGWLPGVPPIGYKTVVEDGKKIHVPDPVTKHIMRAMFELYLDPSRSVASIANELAARGVRTRMGHPYSKSRLNDVLKSPFYIGINRFDGKDYPGKQETFISKELFDKVQAKIRGKRPAVLRQHNPLFKNLISCELCAGMVTWQLQKGRYYGRCQRLKPVCQGVKLVREDRLEEQIVAQLNNLICPSPEIIDWVSDELRNRRVDQSEACEETLKALNIQIARIERMDSMLYDDKLAGDISREVYETKHAAFAEQKASFEAKRVKVLETNTDDAEQRLALLKLSQKAAEIWETRTIEQKRLIIIKLFGSLTFNNGFISVTYTNFVRVIANNTLKTKEILGR